MFVTMSLFRKTGCCAFVLLLCSSMPAYCASSVRNLGDAVRVSEPDVGMVNTRASSLPVAKKMVSTSLNAKNTKTSSTKDATNSSQRMPYGMHVSSVAVPTFISSSSSTEFAGQDVVDELAERIGLLENGIVTVNTDISNLQSEVADIVAALDEINDKFDGYAKTSDLAVYAKTGDLKEYAKSSDVPLKSDLTAYAKIEDLNKVAEMVGPLFACDSELCFITKNGGVFPVNIESHYPTNN